MVERYTLTYYERRLDNIDAEGENVLFIIARAEEKMVVSALFVLAGAAVTVYASGYNSATHKNASKGSRVGKH